MRDKQGKSGAGRSVKAEPKNITSTANAIIKEAAKLKRKRNRYALQRFLVEGEDLLDAALERDIAPRQVFVLSGHEQLASAAAAAGVREIYSCGEKVMGKVAELSSGSRVVAVFDMPEYSLSGEVVGSGGGPLLYIAATGDPGNVGTLIRSAVALGASGVALAPGTADPFSPKALRATMGSIFQIPVYMALASADLISRARGAGLPVICADPHSGDDLWDADLGGDFVLVLGSERGGVPDELRAAADATVCIPQSGKAESLNVAVAATVILYEALRQRQGTE